MTARKSRSRDEGTKRTFSGISVLAPRQYIVTRHRFYIPYPDGPPVREVARWRGRDSAKDYGVA